jgi:hypothetical protein
MTSCKVSGLKQTPSMAGTYIAVGSLYLDSQQLVYSTRVHLNIPVSVYRLQADAREFSL